MFCRQCWQDDQKGRGRPFVFWKKYQSFAYFRKYPEKVTPSIRAVLDQLQARKFEGSSSSSSRPAEAGSPVPDAPVHAAVDDDDDEDWTESDWQCWRDFKKLKAEGGPSSFFEMQQKLQGMTQQTQSFFNSWKATSDKLKLAEEAAAAQAHIHSITLQEKDKVFEDAKQAFAAEEAQWKSTEVLC